MFSHRLPFHLPRNPISDALTRRRASGLPILDLTESNPTRAGIVYPDADILCRIPECRNTGLRPVVQRTASGARPGRRTLRRTQTRVVLTASSSEAYSWLFKLLCDPGDEILTPRPSYPLFEYLAALESVRIRQYPLRYDSGWFIDFEPLDASINEGPAPLWW